MSEPTVPIPPAEASREPSHPLLSILVREFHLAAESLEPHQEQLDKAGLEIARVKQILLKGNVVTEEIFQQGVARLFGLERHK